MKYNIYCIKDIEANEYNLPFFAKTDKQAIRMYNDGLYAQANEMKKSPMYENLSVSEIVESVSTRYQLYSIGIYDVESGFIDEVYSKIIATGEVV